MDSGMGGGVPTGLSEAGARPLCAKLCSGIAHAHACNIAHHDLKLENILLMASDLNALMIADWGFAVPLDTPCSNTAGTAAYKAPEIFTGDEMAYDAGAADAWALGIIMFTLLSGFTPWSEAVPTEPKFERLLSDQAAGMGACASIFGFYGRRCPFNGAFTELIDGLLLAEEPSRRHSAAAAASHPWLRPPEPPPAARMDSNLSELSDLSLSDKRSPRPVYRSTSGKYDEPVEGDSAADWEEPQEEAYRSLSLEGEDLEAYAPPEGAAVPRRQLADRGRAR